MSLVFFKNLFGGWCNFFQDDTGVFLVFQEKTKPPFVKGQEKEDWPVVWQVVSRG